jgi:hypothetical protein
MRIQVTGATALQSALLAAPFMAISLWLGASVESFGLVRAVQGVLFAGMLAMAVLLLGRRFGSRGLVPAVLLYLVNLVLTVADAASWYMQGSSFNERFFVHVNPDNVRVSLEAYPVAIVGAVAGIALLVAYVVLVLRRAAHRRIGGWAWVPAVLLMALSLGIDASPHRLYAYFANAEHSEGLAHSAAGDRILSLIDPEPTPPSEVVARPGRNLVFVYLESLERSYTDERRFPGLVPEINRLRSEGLDFSGFRTFPGATYTISGIFSSQCGAPYLSPSIFGSDVSRPGFVPGNDHTTADSFHPGLACLGDVLHAAGYDQTYLSGVILSFANTDVFFRLHHYDRALGKPQIEKLHAGKLPTEGWGLQDGDIFDQALDEFREKQATGKPFSVVLSTIDTHPPRGYLLPGCKPYAPIRNDMLDAVHCSDRLLGQFVDRLSHEPGWKDTVVVVMSDHVVMLNVASSLYPPDDQRQPLLFVLNAGQGERAARMYHMDVAPTVLSLLGVESNVRFMAGADRSRTGSVASPLPANEVAEAVLRDALWSSRKPPALCGGGTLAQWNGPHGLQVGGWTLPLMRGGWHVDRLPPTNTLLVFVDSHKAELQMLPRGEEHGWIERALANQGSVFQVTPFLDAQGSRQLALDWLAPDGAWASLGSVRRVQDIRLATPQCRSLLQTLEAATPGTRLDFSAVFGLPSIPAHLEQRPGYVMSETPPRGPSADLAAFMYSRLTSESPGYGSVHVNRMKRITLMPSRTRQATAEFDVTGLARLELVPRIDNLMGSCLRRTDTGIVGVQLSLDGKPVMPRFLVDRDFSQAITVDTRGHHRLKVEVDKGNATPDCDYFATGFSGVVAQMQATASAAPHIRAP